MRHGPRCACVCIPSSSPSMRKGRPYCTHHDEEPSEARAWSGSRQPKAPAGARPAMLSPKEAAPGSHPVPTPSRPSSCRLSRHSSRCGPSTAAPAPAPAARRAQLGAGPSALSPARRSGTSTRSASCSARPESGPPNLKGQPGEEAPHRRLPSQKLAPQGAPLRGSPRRPPARRSAAARVGGSAPTTSSSASARVSPGPARLAHPPRLGPGAPQLVPGAPGAAPLPHHLLRPRPEDIAASIPSRTPGPGRPVLPGLDPPPPVGTRGACTPTRTCSSSSPRPPGAATPPPRAAPGSSDPALTTSRSAPPWR